jgi:hypothetical protein
MEPIVPITVRFPEDVANRIRVAAPHRGMNAMIVEAVRSWLDELDTVQAGPNPTPPSPSPGSPVPFPGDEP